MKRILMLAFIVSSVHVMGQAPTFKSYQSLSLVFPKKKSPSDSVVKVVNLDEYKELEKKFHSGKGKALFLNGKQVDASVWSTLPFSIMDSAYVVNENMSIDQVSYFRQYYFKTKRSFTPKLVSLNDLKAKYVNLKTKHTIFMLDGNIIDADYDQYIVDENYILQILVETMPSTKKNRDIGFIRLLTRSPENVKKSKEIRIRGSEVSMNK